MEPYLDFTNKVVLITGAAQGFGKLLAEALAIRGAKLVISDVNAKGIEEVKSSFIAKGFDVVAMPCDVSIDSDCLAFRNLAVDKFGQIDIAVNNAGIAHDFTPLHEIDESTMNSQFNVNVKGVQSGMKYQIQQMLKQGEGTILNVSSMAGIGGAAGLSAYSAAKHAVIGLTKSASAEYARHNIRINAVCPFFTLTQMVTNASDEAKQAKMSRGTPMNRLGQPEEIVAMMVLMLSPANTYMTGQCVAIDGGLSAI